MFKATFPTEPQQLENLFAQTKVYATHLLEYSIYCLRDHAVGRQVTLDVRLYKENEKEPLYHSLKLVWFETSDTLKEPLSIHLKSITEWAACGLAIAVAPLYLPYGVLELAQIGESFDYWLGDTEGIYGLEVSGMMGGSLARRTRKKRDQLQANPSGVGGYTCVIGFDKQQVRLSFYEGAK